MGQQKIKILDRQKQRTTNKGFASGGLNTFVIYRHRTIIEKFIDLKPTTANFKKVSNTLDKTKSKYFNLSEPKHD